MKRVLLFRYEGRDQQERVVLQSHFSSRRMMRRYAADAYIR